MKGKRAVTDNLDTQRHFRASGYVMVLSSYIWDVMDK